MRNLSTAGRGLVEEISLGTICKADFQKANLRYEPEAIKVRGTLWSAVTCHRFRQATCRRRTEKRVQCYRHAAERGAVWLTSQPDRKSGDKSPHSKYALGLRKRLFQLCRYGLMLVAA